MFNLNMLDGVVRVRPDDFEGAKGWTWISDPSDVTWPVIASDWVRHHKPVLQRLFPNGGRSVIMAGGNCGMYPALLSTVFKRVYTFEPDPIHFHCLVNNCQMPNVMKFQAALGSHRYHVGMKEPVPGNTGMAQVGKVDGDNILVMPVDSLALNELDLMFIDTEGFEEEVIEGAILTLERCKPKLILELGDLAAGEVDNYNRTTQLLEGFNYTKITQIGRLDFLIEHESATN